MAKNHEMRVYYLTSDGKLVYLGDVAKNAQAERKEKL